MNTTYRNEAHITFYLYAMRTDNRHRYIIMCVSMNQYTYSMFSSCSICP